MFHLSGAVNFFLFLITKPELLLFPRHGQPGQLDGSEQEIQLNAPRLQHSPEMASRRISEDI